MRLEAEPPFFSTPRRSRHIMRHVRLVALGMTLLAAACASGGGGEGGGDQGGQDRYRLTAADLAPYATQNLYQAVQRARRFWLQGSGGRAPRIFVNGTEMGGAANLSEYMPSQVQEITFITATDAMTQYGPDYAGGVINVILR
jgi:hypothetical protein